MALQETSTAKGNFFSIKHGGFCLESKEPADGYKETQVKDLRTGKDITKWIKTYAEIIGKIGRLEWYDRTIDEVRYMGIKITVRDNGESYSIDLPYDKNPYNYFMRVMDSIDYEQDVQFIAYPKKSKKGHQLTEFAIKQNGEWLKQNYTKANPGDCPQATQDQMGNWDYRERQYWLKNRLETIIIPHVEELNATGDQDEPVYDEPAFAGPVSKPAAKAAKVNGTPPEMEAEYLANRKFVDTPPDDDEPPF